MTYTKLGLFLLSLAAVGCIALSGQVNIPETAPKAVEEVVRITPEDPRSIQRAVLAAVKTGQSTLVIPPGVYEIPGAEPVGKRNFHIRVTGAHDLAIEATGVTLIFCDRYQHSLGFVDCKNVTFRGATLRRKTSSVSQGRIEAIREEGKSIDVRIDKGYPTDIENRTLFGTFWPSVFSMDRTRWMANYRAPTPPVEQQLEPDLYRIPMSEGIKQIGVALQVGQPLGWRGEVFDDVRTQNCQDMKLIDITVQGGSGMCYHEMGGGGGNLYRNCKLTYGPVPPGGTEKPLWSSSADSFHSGDTRRGPIIENCFFEGSDDDAIAIHGTYGCMVQNGGKRIVVWRAQYASNPLFTNVGDQLRFYDAGGVHQTDRKVVAVREFKGFQLTPEYQPNKLYRFFSNPANAVFIEVTLDDDLAGQPNWLVCNADEMGNGYIIRNTVIRSNGGRGIMAKASDGLIDGCTIENTARAAIEFMPEHVLWPESDYVRNVVVRNNIIRNVSFNRQDGFLRHAGALTIYAFRSGGVGYLPAGGHRNILIENNTFEDNNGPNMLIASCDGVTVRNNRFIRPMVIPSKFGRTKGVNPEALIWVTQAKHVQFLGNTVEAPGAGLKTFVGTSATAEVTGAETGVEVKK